MMVDEVKVPEATKDALVRALLWMILAVLIVFTIVYLYDRLGGGGGGGLEREEWGGPEPDTDGQAPYVKPEWEHAGMLEGGEG
jgi:hypothetical protein